MIRVVLDTNIVVSSQMHSAGLPAVIFNLAINQRMVELCISAPVLAEYADVLNRPRLKIPPVQVELVLSAMQSIARLVTPTETVTAASDPDDNVFLECAQAAQAEYLITGNIRHFPESWGVTRIVTVREFFEILAASLSEYPQVPSPN